MRHFIKRDTMPYTEVLDFTMTSKNLMGNVLLHQMSTNCVSNGARHG